MNENKNDFKYSVAHLLHMNIDMIRGDEMKVKIQRDDFLKNRILTELKLNSKKTMGLYFLITLDIDKNSYIKKPILFNVDSLESRRLYLDINPDDFIFHGDDVIFKVVKGSSSVLYRYKVKEDSLNMIVDIPYRIKTFEYYNDNLYFTAAVKVNEDDGITLSGTEIPFYREGEGMSAECRNCLFMYEESIGVTRLSGIEIDIDSVSYDFDHNRVIFNAFKCQSCKTVSSYVFSLDISKKEITLWTTGNYRISYAQPIGDGDIVYAGVDLDIKSRNDNQDLFKINTSTGEITILNGYSDRSNETPGVVTDSRFTSSRQVIADNGRIYFTLVNRYGVCLNSIGPDGDFIEYPMELRTIDAFEITDKGILAIGLMGMKLHELYLFNEGALTCLTQYNDWVNQVRHTSRPKLLRLIDGDNEIDGWVVEPHDKIVGKRYPGILIIHGGPKMIYSDIYSHDIQMLAAEGYYVFYCNPRGSDGRGDDFANIRGSYGEIAFKELMRFTDCVLEKYPSIDKNNIGVTGRSYGGFMTNYIITKTNRFKSAISESGISNLMTTFTSSDIGYSYIFEYMGNCSTPWTSKEYIAASPIMNAHKVTTPTLFIHGLEDRRCNYTESLNMYSALNYLGVSTKLCLFEGENHGLNVRGRPKSKSNMYNEVINWFDKYLKEGVGDEYFRLAKAAD